MRVDAIKHLVIDASVAVAWCFSDETTRFTEKVLDLVSKAAEVYVPPMWPFEVANALLTAERRKRITVTQTTSFLNRIGGLPVIVELQQVARAHDQVLSVARQHGLTVYDAAYLELAVRKGLPLATLDERLKQAAVAAGTAFIA